MSERGGTPLLTGGYGAVQIDCCSKVRKQVKIAPNSPEDAAGDMDRPANRNV
jgi:hypothetical protein